MRQEIIQHALREVEAHSAGIGQGSEFVVTRAQVDRKPEPLLALIDESLLVKR